MDIIKFLNPHADLRMEHAHVVNPTQIESVTWIERFREAGEFTITGRNIPFLFDRFRRGDFISHTDSTDIMVVEDHKVSTDDDGQKIEITGRSITSLFENVVVGSNKDFPTGVPIENYTVGEFTVWEQAIFLIGHHINPSEMEMGTWAGYDDLLISSFIRPGRYHPAKYREFPPKDLYSTLMELLEVEQFGLSVFRPGFLSDLTTPGLEQKTTILVTDGNDLSNSVIFAERTDSPNRADQFWSTRGYYNCAYVTSRWCETYVDWAPLYSGHRRRVMHVDASHLDNSVEAMPTGASLEFLLGAMEVAGEDALARARATNTREVDIAPESSPYLYRKDYKLGDTVGARGLYDDTYGQSDNQQVVEYVEFQDAEGFHGYPSLKQPTTDPDEPSGGT